MGCGACNCNDNKAIITPKRMFPLQQKLLIKIQYYKKYQHLFVNIPITLQQVKQVEEILASGKRLQQLTIQIKNVNNVNIKCETNNNHSGPANSQINSKQINAQQLLSPFQRIIWKLLLFITPPKLPHNKHPILHTQNITYHKQFPPPTIQSLSISFSQIKLDVNRTYPEVKSLNRLSLQNVLKNITSLHIQTGYTQGMNFYIGFLLQCGFTKEQAFYIYVHLFERVQYLFIEIFSQQFKMVTRSLQCVKDKAKKLSEHNSNIVIKLQSNTCSQCSQYKTANNNSSQIQVHTHQINRFLQQLQQLGISPHLYSFSWFLCVFLYTLNVDSCALIWDYMIKQQTGLCTIINIAIMILAQISVQHYNQISNMETNNINSDSHTMNMMQLLKSDTLKNKYNTQSIRRVISKIKYIKHVYQFHEDSNSTDNNIKMRNILCYQDDIFVDEYLKGIINSDSNMNNSQYSEYISKIRGQRIQRIIPKVNDNNNKQDGNKNIQY